jgi:tRNA (guanine37-N1)-methyltransferase
MKNPALRVVRSEGERTRALLREVHALRSDLRIEESEGWIFLPVVPGATVPPELGELLERDFVPANPRGPQDYRDLLSNWPEADRENLPRAFDVIGDVVLVRIPPALTHRGDEIGSALIQFVPGARIVGADHGVHGVERQRSVERLAGSGTWRTRHRENGLEFDVDLEAAYFSPRLAREHARVASEIRAGDRVYDLCCGVGPFAVTIAEGGRATRITAVDVNPLAIDLLKSTLSRYPWGRMVTPKVGSLERFLEGAEPVEDAVLNLPHEGIKYLPSVGNVVTPGGRIFFYEVVDRDGSTAHDRDLVSRLGTPPDWQILDRHVVHPYSPSADLVGFTFVRSSGG